MQCGKIGIKALTVETLVARNENVVMIASMARCDSLQQLGVLRMESRGQFCVGKFGRNLASVAV